ncbi:nuclear transport factor 2 family protein [Streptomyces sp. NPDC052101]|uniref:nuclear transport factor 2 family protein n=1 Tax=Streptomyces sp. NPDC052101 TaxID=3155763 RepID=UPI003445E8D6
MIDHTTQERPQAAAPAALYTQVQQFYAHQVGLLDDLRAEEFADTFTADGVLVPSPAASPVRGRPAIAAALRAAHERRFGTEAVRRRHWHTMLRVETRPDGALTTRYYSLVLITRPWDPAPVMGPSSVVEDVLVHESGQLLTHERRVTPDHLSF